LRAAWPVRAIVAENGAVALMPDGGRRCAPSTPRTRPRARTTPRLRRRGARVLREVPGATLAQDSAGRVTDIAIDHSEFARLDAAHRAGGGADAPRA
jgi:hypothetical protein